MITRLEISEQAGDAEFGMVCQRLVPWAGAADETPPPTATTRTRS
jgi:hypothetical protein